MGLPLEAGQLSSPSLSFLSLVAVPLARGSGSSRRRYEALGNAAAGRVPYIPKKHIMPQSFRETDPGGHQAGLLLLELVGREFGKNLRRGGKVSMMS